jgi:hypothetical protein
MIVCASNYVHTPIDCHEPEPFIETGAITAIDPTYSAIALTHSAANDFKSDRPDASAALTQALQ